MAGITVTPDEFADIVVSFILDAMTKPDVILPNNVEFGYIIHKMVGGGMKSPLLSYYLDTSSITRGKYKMIQKSFTEQGDRSSIVISKSSNDKMPDDEKSTIKHIVKQTLRTIKSHKMRRNNGMPLNEETVDKIIDKVLESM